MQCPTCHLDKEKIINAVTDLAKQTSDLYDKYKGSERLSKEAFELLMLQIWAEKTTKETPETV